MVRRPTETTIGAQFGLKLGPLPEGGWMLIIDTAPDDLEGHQAQGDCLMRSAEDWFEWRFETDGFHAEGGSRNISDMLEAFFDEIDRMAASGPRRN